MSQTNPFSAFSVEPGLFNFCAGRSSNERCSSSSNLEKRRLRRMHIERKSTAIPPECPPASSGGPKHEKVPETNKAKLTTPSGLTGVIPCRFDGSSYFSKLQPPTFFPAEESIKKEMHQQSESSPPSTQIVAVSKILKGIPQNPHFIPLKTYSNVAKQKLINAWDNIFEETVDKLLSMQITRFSSESRRLWETMEELEKMGYNVMSLRRRLIELADVLINRRAHKREIIRLKNEAEQHRMEKSKLEFKIVKLKAKVEAENASVDDIMQKVAQKEDEMPCFSALFACQAIKSLVPTKNNMECTDN